MKNKNFIQFMEKDFINIFKVILFNKDSIIKTSKNQNFIYTGILFIFISTFISKNFSINLIFDYILQTIVIVLILFFFHLIAKYLFEGKSNFLNYFLVISNVFILYLLTIIPLVIIQLLVGISVFILNIYIIEIIYKISRIKSILISVISLIFLYLLTNLIYLI